MTNRRRWTTGLAGLGFVLFAAGVAPADSTIFVKGEVLNLGFFADTGVEVGDVVKITYLIRPLAVSDDQREADDKVGEYIDDSQGYTIDIGKGVYSVTCAGTRIFVNNNVSNDSTLPPNNDRLTLRGIDCEDSRGEASSEFTSVQIIDTTGNAIDDDALTDGNVAALLAAVDGFRGGTSSPDVSISFRATKIADADPNTPLLPPVGLISNAKTKFEIKKVVKDKAKGDLAIELLGDGSFTVDPEDPSAPLLTGTWTDPKGKGREYELELDPASEDALLEALSQSATDASGKNQNVTYKGDKPPKISLTQSKQGALAFSLKAKVKAENDKAKVKKGVFQLKGNGEISPPE